MNTEERTPEHLKAEKQFRELVLFGNRWESERTMSKEENIEFKKEQVRQMHDFKRKALSLRIPGVNSVELIHEYEERMPGSGAYIEYKILVLFYSDILGIRRA